METPGSQPAAVKEQADERNLALTAGQTGLYPQVILFGDSITQRAGLTLQARLQNYYTRRADIVNRGFSGYTTSLAVSILPYILPLTTPDPSPTQPVIRLVTIFFGANDAALPGNAQHVPIETFKADLRRIAEYPVFKRHGAKIIFITPGPIDEWQLTNPLTRTVRNARDYACVVKEAAKEMQLPCVDVWTAFMELARKAAPNLNISENAQDTEHAVKNVSNAVQANTKQLPPDDCLPGSLALPPNPVLNTLLDDGLHFATAGYGVLYDELVATIEREVPECTPENLSWVFRDWKEVLGVAPVQQQQQATAVSAVAVDKLQGPESDSTSTLPVETVQVATEVKEDIQPDTVGEVVIRNEGDTAV